MTGEGMTWPMVMEIVEKSIQQNNSFLAFQLLESRIDKNLLRVQREEWKDWIACFAKILEIDAPKSEAFISAKNLAGSPSNINACIRLGMDLIDIRKLNIAVVVLGEARQLDPKNTLVLSEMIAALELDGRHKEAVRFLQEVPELVASDNLLTYLLAFNSFFIGDPDTPRQLLPILRKSEDDKISFMTQRIEQMLVRADIVKSLNESENDQRGLHFILTGGLLINNFQNTSSSYDTAAKLFNDIQGLITVLDVWRILPKKILFPAEHNCEILAHLMANIIGVPTSKWFASPEEGLITLYDSAYIIPELIEPLRTINPNQTVFQCVANSTIEGIIAPDILSRFYVRNAPIWGPGFDANNAYVLPLEGTPKSIADGIFNSVGTTKKMDQNELSGFAQTIYEFMPINPFYSANIKVNRQRLWNYQL
jgi:hypothetical protein